MAYTNKERGEHLLKYADSNIDGSGETPLMVGLYKSSLRKEGQRLMKRPDRDLEELNTDEVLIDAFTDDPDKFFSILDSLQDNIET